MDARSSCLHNRQCGGVAIPLLSALIESHLIYPDHENSEEQRFQILETIREFGLEKLQIEGELAETASRHVRWCAKLSLLATYYVDRRRASLLEADIDNLRSALHWSVRYGVLKDTLMFSGTLAQYWYLLGATNTGAINSLLDEIVQGWPSGDFFEDAAAWSVEVMSAPLQPPDREMLLCVWAVAWLAGLQRDYPRAQEITHYMRRSYRDLGFDLGVATSTLYLAILAVEQGNYAGAAENAKAALEVLRQEGDQVWSPHMIYLLGAVLYHQKKSDDAHRLLNEARDLFQRAGQGWSEAGPLTYLARIARDRKEYDEALRLQQAALRLRQRHSDRYAAAGNIRGIGEILALSERFVDAVQLYGAAESIRKGYGPPVTPLGQPKYQRDLNHLREALGEHQFTLEWERGASLSFRQAADLAERIELRPDPGESSRTSVADPHSRLTPRELDVLRLLAHGMTSQEIAESLSISPRTVSTHQSNVYGKLGVNTQTAAVAFAYQHGLVQTDPDNDDL